MRVFVASTFVDLLSYRSAVTRAILAAGNITEDMLYWSADESPPLDVSLRHLRSSDLVILLLAHRYGTPPSGDSCSITEQEYGEALRLRIPILAFSVDPDYPWPPRYVETDPDIRAHMADFVSSVISNVTVKQFTSPESLEVAITHALTQFRGRGSGAKLPYYVALRLQQVSRPESLYYSPDSTINIGHAPDGGALLLAITRGIRVEEDLGRIAHRLGKNLDDPTFKEIFSHLNQEARAFATATGIYNADKGGSSADAYVSSESLIELASPSLFQSMLKESRVVRTEFSGLPSEFQHSHISGSVDARADEITSLAGENRFLCVELEADQEIWSGGWLWRGSDPPRLALWRLFIEEGLERLTGTRYIIRADEERGTSNLIDTEQPEQYLQKWADLLMSATDEQLRSMSYQIIIPRYSIVRFVLELVEEVAELHDLGRIHGDIKPSNILVNRRGKTLIDEVGLNVGEISPTVTAGWSPAEQLLRRPLTCAADIFPLGQILLHVLGGEPLGKEVRYRMPGGEIATIFDDPTVYMAADGLVARAADRIKWCRVIEKALMADPNERWETAREMADEIRDAIHDESILGMVSMRLPWGSRPALYNDETGGTAVGWVMRSGRSQTLL